jgi:adenosine deaminase
MSTHPAESFSAERTWLERLPKVELHLHLEGAIPIEALWELIGKYGGDPAAPNREALSGRFAYRDFPHFIEVWVWKSQFLREYEDFTFIAEAVAENLASQNIRYAEAFFSPGDFRRFGLEPQGLAEAIRRGLDRVAGVRVALIPDLIRDHGPENAAAVLEAIDEVKDLGIIGVGMGGSEQLVGPEVFQAVYERARELGFRTTAHAGEACGPESIWGAIRALRVDRIGHGTRAREDESLVDYLAHHQIPIELCPISNVRTGVVGSISEHPTRLYLERGIPVSINTDDPLMFGNSLAGEFHLLERELRFTREDVKTLILQGIDSSWLSTAEKAALKREFMGDPAWNET